MNSKKYVEVLKKLNSINLFRPGRLNLENMQNMMLKLDNPQRRLKFIHVEIAGTNGKGSVSLKMQKVLQHQGYKVGLYTSPHLFSFRERIMINDHKISEAFICESLTRLYEIAERHLIPLTFFEYLTCVSFLYYLEEKVDYISLETGLGGRLDATNIVDTTMLSIITSISYDHTSVLGNTLEEIATEKAGIIKQNVPVVIGPNAQPRHTFESVAEQHNSKLFLVKNNKEATFIEENNSIVQQACSVLTSQHGIRISEASIQKGLAANQPCRSQLIPHHRNPNCEIYVDVGHNPDALVRLFHSLSSQLKTVVIFGTSSQKDAQTSIGILQKNASSIYLIQANHFRAMPIEQLEQAWQKIGNKSIEPSIVSSGNIKSTIDHVLAITTQPTKIVICGSFFIMRETFEALGIEIDSDPYELNERLPMQK